jgi:predicted permease
MIPTTRRWNARQELKLAWRAVRARGWRAALAAGLLGVALAANAVVFASADSLVFRRVPYADAGNLVEIHSRTSDANRTASALPPALLDTLRAQRDLFVGVHGWGTRPAFLVSQGEPEVLDVVSVTPGLLSMIGVVPAWGRPLLPADVQRTDVEIVVIAESLARARFGDPARAVDQRIETTDRPFMVVGVMPEGFRFPGASFQVWRAADPIIQRARVVQIIARAAPGMPVDRLGGALATRSAPIRESLGLPAGVSLESAPLRLARIDDESRRMLFVLLGAAACLLLTACANIAGLELAGATRRRRLHAVQLALGASRSSLARTALFEGAYMLLPALALGAALGSAGTSALAAGLPDRAFDSVNPIDLDVRALLFMAAAAALTWVAVSVPPALFAGRASVPDLLRAEGRSAAGSRGGARLRRLLTTGEVALAVMLLTGGVLYARTYRNLLALPTGFQAEGLWVVTVTIPPQNYASAQATDLLGLTIVDRLRAHPDVTAISRPMYLPPGPGETYSAAPEIDGAAAGLAGLSIAVNYVDAAFFDTMGIPIRLGRGVGGAAPPTEAVIDETMARRFWPDRNPIGRTFRISPGQGRGRTPYTVVGVAGHVRNDRDDLTSPSETHFQIYVSRQPPPPPPPTSTRPQSVTDQPLYRTTTVAFRTARPIRMDALVADLRQIDPQIRFRLDSMAANYARRFEDRRIASAIVAGFAGLAFVVALAGVYGVMAFLVASRSREIGIRMALGASRTQIRSLVLASSMRLVLAGATVGVGAALAAASLIESQLFGVTPTDPLTYVLVAGAVMSTATLATWQPARQAAGVDPAVALRAE